MFTFCAVHTSPTRWGQSALDSFLKLAGAALHITFFVKSQTIVLASFVTGWQVKWQNDRHHWPGLLEAWEVLWLDMQMDRQSIVSACTLSSYNQQDSFHCKLVTIRHEETWMWQMRWKKIQLENIKKSHTLYHLLVYYCFTVFLVYRSFIKINISAVSKTVCGSCFNFVTNNIEE